MRDPYKVLGISPNATDIEVKNAYRALARKYHPDNYDSSNPLAELADEKMKEINEAYDEIMNMRKGGAHASGAGAQGANAYSTNAEGASGAYRTEFNAIRDLINRRRMKEAETALARMPASARVAEWHYLESLVLMQRGFVNDAMRELEIACSLDPDNVEYQQAKQMFNQTAAGYGRTYGGNTTYRRGGCDACDVCNGLICADCCCECMGGDLISCC
jgi:DnaJ-class molecular chaperone